MWLNWMNVVNNLSKEISLTLPRSSFASFFLVGIHSVFSGVYLHIWDMSYLYLILINSPFKLLFYCIDLGYLCLKTKRVSE